MARLEAWRDSGLTAPEFAAGKDFTASGLRFWKSRVQRSVGRKADVRIARVVRSGPGAPPVEGGGEVTAIVVEVGRMRVQVRRGFEVQELRQVLELLVDLEGGR